MTTFNGDESNEETEEPQKRMYRDDNPAELMKAVGHFFSELATQKIWLSKEMAEEWNGTILLLSDRSLRRPIDYHYVFIDSN